MSQPIVRRLAASPSFFLLSLLVGLLVCGLAAAESGCPDVEPEAWSPCTADQDGVSCNLGEEYGGDPFCWKDCDGEVWTHLCAGGGMPPPQDDEQAAEQPAGTAFECSSLADCASCLEHPSCDGWAGGFGCYSTCSYDMNDPQSLNVADVSCYDSTNGGCQAESSDAIDYQICAEQTTCGGCMSTGKSGGGSCLWMANDFEGGNGSGFCTNSAGMMCCPADSCPAETTTEDNAVDTEVVEDEGQFTDIIADCQVPIGAAIGCFSTSQEPACEGFDPMSLLAGELPIPENCEEADDLVCSALVGCCDKEIADIAACAAKSNLDLDCDIDCGTGPIPTPAPDATSSGRPIKTVLHGFSWSLLLAPFIGWNM